MKTPAFLLAEGATISANRAKKGVSLAHDLARQFWVVAAVEEKAVGDHELACFAIMQAAGHRQVAEYLYLKGKAAKAKRDGGCAK